MVRFVSQLLIIPIFQKHGVTARGSSGINILPAVPNQPGRGQIQAIFLLCLNNQPGARFPAAALVTVIVIARVYLFDGLLGQYGCMKRFYNLTALQSAPNIGLVCHTEQKISQTF